MEGWSSTLFSLVDELLLLIIEQIDSRETLCNLAATCSRLQELSEPFIWSTLLVLNGKHASHVAKALENREERASYVRELSVRYHYTGETGIESLDPLIPAMSTLRSLHIESPCPNNDPWRNELANFESWTRLNYQALFQAAADIGRPNPVLPMLQSLTLHAHGYEQGPFSFSETTYVFLHPTLRHITISCTNFEADNIPLLWSSNKYKTTPLQSLTFIECNVYMSLLDEVLRLPKALKNLSIGERLYVFDSCRPSGRPRSQHPDLLDALQHQADSLEQLAHVGGNVQYCRGPLMDKKSSKKFRKLQHLKHLDLSFESMLNYCVVNGDYPQSLESVRLSDDALTIAHQPYSRYLRGIMRFTHQIAVHGVSKAVDVNLCLTHNLAVLYVPLDLLQDVWGPNGADDRKSVYQIAGSIKARGSRFRILAQTFESGKSYIPPYMYGEETPKEVIVYDSNNYWTFLNTSWEAIDNETIPKHRLCCESCTRQELECVNPGDGTSCNLCGDLGDQCTYPSPPNVE